MRKSTTLFAIVLIFSFILGSNVFGNVFPNALAVNNEQALLGLNVGELRARLPKDVFEEASKIPDKAHYLLGLEPSNDEFEQYLQMRKFSRTRELIYGKNYPGVIDRSSPDYRLQGERSLQSILELHGKKMRILYTHHVFTEESMYTYWSKMGEKNLLKKGQPLLLGLRRLSLGACLSRLKDRLPDFCGRLGLLRRRRHHLSFTNDHHPGMRLGGSLASMIPDLNKIGGMKFTDTDLVVQLVHQDGDPFPSGMDKLHPVSFSRLLSLHLYLHRTKRPYLLISAFMNLGGCNRRFFDFFSHLLRPLKKLYPDL